MDMTAPILKKHIFWPTRTRLVTQEFGESKACIDKQGKVVSKPFGGCPEGYRDLYQSVGLAGHNGTDSALWRGEPIYFSVSLPIKWFAKTEIDHAGGIGVDVVSSEEVFVPSVFNGQTVKGLINNRPDGYQGYIKFRFWHLLKTNVYDGQEIKFGDLIGWGDSSGISSGDHLHWGPKMCNKDGWGINKQNLFAGAFDGRLFREEIFCLDFLRIREQLTLLQKVVRLFYQVKNF
jgi:hypothetical protein